MQEYKSEVKFINYPAEAVFSKLSNLSNLESIKDRLPQDKIQDLYFDTDTCRFSVSPVGTIGIRIIEREPFKTIKFASEQSPMAFNLWIQLAEKADQPGCCYLLITAKADIPFMLKSMVGNKLQEGINRIAEALSMMPY